MRCLPVVFLFLAPRAFAGQPLETESADLIKAGTIEIEVIYEYQTSAAGKEHAVPLAADVGLTDRVQLTIEPVPYTSIRPTAGKAVTGPGDTEATLAVRFFDGSGWVPALALAAEAKIPTAKDKEIGTGKADYAGYLWATTRPLTDLEVHANAGYTFVGQPGGDAPKLDNVYNYAIAVEYHVTKAVDLLAEVLGNTASTKGATTQDNTTSGSGGEAPDTPTPPANGTGTSNVTPEAAGGETIGMVGARFQVSSTVALGLGFNYDNNDALLIRTGVTFKF